MSIKSIIRCLFIRNPIPQIDDNITFVLYKPKNPIFLVGNDKDKEFRTLEFNDVDNQIPTKSIPPLHRRYQASAEPKSEGGNIPAVPTSAEMQFIRIVYFVFLEKGEILTVSFQKKFQNNDDDKIWMLNKYRILNNFRGNPDKIIRYFDSNPNGERVSRGLDQDFSKTAVVFFYVYNEHMVFSDEKFSFTEMPDNPQRPSNPGDPYSPFTMIRTSQKAKFFGLYNSFYEPWSGDKPYRYKFNLHMETIGYTIDQPQHIPFIIDPVIINQGPPR